MRKRQPLLPRLWLMTDERLGDGVLATIRALPPRSGVVFRHYGLPPAERRALLRRVRWLAQARRLMLSVGGTSHGRRPGALTAPVHSICERVAAERAGAQLLFVSPVFATRSHPGAQPLGRMRFGSLIKDSRTPVIALGGMNADRARGLRCLGIYGWAGIDALAAKSQKRKAVPT